MLIAVCVLSPAQLEHVLGFTSFRLRFGGVLRGRFVLRTWFDRVPAGTVLAGTRLFRTRSDYKKWCVPRTCSENIEPYREHICERPVCWPYLVAWSWSVVPSHQDLGSLFVNDITLYMYVTRISYRLQYKQRYSMYNVTPSGKKRQWHATYMYSMCTCMFCS